MNYSVASGKYIRKYPLVVSQIIILPSSETDARTFGDVGLHASPVTRSVCPVSVLTSAPEAAIQS